MTTPRRAVALVGAILLLAAVPRVLVAAHSTSLSAGGDPLFYLHAAASFVRGDGIDYQKPHWGGTHWPPGQPVFLSLFADETALAGTPERPAVPPGFLGAFDLRAAQIVTALLSLVGIALLIELGRRVFDLRTGLVAGGLVALYPNAIAISGTLFAESNHGVLATLAAVVATGPSRTLARPFVAGLAFGASAYFRSIALPMAAPFALAAAFRGPEGAGGARRALAAALLLLGLAAAIAPWSARNTERYGRFLLLDTSGGEAMYLGNNDFPPMTMDWPLYRRAEGGRERCRLPNPVENFGCEISNGVDHILAHPGLFLERTLSRAIGLANPTSWTVYLAHHDVYGDDPARVAWITWLCALTFTGLAGAAILGLAGADFTADRLALAATVAVALGIPALLQAETRYRLAALPAVAIFAAHFLLHARAVAGRLRVPWRAVLAVGGFGWLALGWVVYGAHLF